MTSVVTGETKDPGIRMFRRLKAKWHKMTIDYTNLVKFDWNNENKFLIERTEIILEWAREHLLSQSFPRGDYKELVQLIIVWLGGAVKNFQFKQPGPDHHARWMSKSIYILKLELLSNQFELDNQERSSIKIMAEFVGLFYGQAYLKCPLSAAAPRNDFDFLQNIH